MEDYNTSEMLAQDLVKIAERLRNEPNDVTIVETKQSISRTAKQRLTIEIEWYEEF